MNGYALSALLIAFVQVQQAPVAPVAGKWRGDLQLPERNGVPGNILAYMFDLQVHEGKLSGHIHLWNITRNSNTNTFEIGDAVITGNKVRFVQLMPNPSGGISRTFVFEGELIGDELILARSQGGTPYKFTARRVNPADQK